MADPIFQLSDSAGPPNGRRYGPQERTAAYAVWRTAARRSFRKTQAMTGVSDSTLAEWAKADGWARRADAEDEAERESVRVALSGLILSEMEKSFARLVALRDSAQSEKVAYDAAVAILGMGGVAPIAKAETSLVTSPRPPKPDAIDARDLAGLSSAELMQIENDIRARSQR